MSTTTPTPPVVLALENDLPPEAASWPPNKKVARLSKQGQEPTTYPIEPPVAPPPDGAPAETDLLLNIAMNDSTDSVVALENAPTIAVAAGNVIQIDSEYMIVTDASDQSNLVVRRATNGSVIAAHAVGATVSIWES